MAFSLRPTQTITIVFALVAIRIYARKQLSYGERVRIMTLLEAGVRVNEVATRLQVNRTTIWRLRTANHHLRDPARVNTRRRGTGVTYR